MQKLLELIARLLVAIGAINWGLYGAFKVDLVAKLGNKTFATFLYLLIGIAGLYFLLSRDFYLPFLGESAMPCGSMPVMTPSGANTEVKIKVDPNVNVLYWAAEENEKIAENPWTAYDKASNAGVAKSDKEGVAVLKVRHPAKYNLPWGKVKESHVHYRVCNNPILLGRVETAEVS
jgi:uncharacterized membrane protein YuzA (DUF378 family)